MRNQMMMTMMRIQVNDFQVSRREFREDLEGEH